MFASWSLVSAGLHFITTGLQLPDRTRRTQLLHRETFTNSCGLGNGDGRRCLLSSAPGEALNTRIAPCFIHLVWPCSLKTCHQAVPRSDRPCDANSRNRQMLSKIVPLELQNRRAVTVLVVLLASVNDDSVAVLKEHIPCSANTAPFTRICRYEA